MEDIDRGTSVSRIISIYPRARSVFKKYGIQFIGKSVSPLESLEKVCLANDLNKETVEKIVKEINDEIRKEQIYQEKMIRNGFIKLTPLAAKNLRLFLKSKPDKNGIRLRLVSSGCSLYQYDMDFGTKAVDNEVEFKSCGITFYIEKKAGPMLKYLEIDYIEEKGGFFFRNPNVEE